MIPDKFLWGNVFFGGKQQIDAKNAHFEIFDSALFLKSVSISLSAKGTFHSRFCTRGEGGPLGPNHFWIGLLFRRNIGTKLAPYVYTLKTTIYQQKEQSKNVSFQNGGQKKKRNFSFVKTVTWPIWKTKFPKGMFQQNLAQIWRPWIYLHFWNNIWKKKCLKMAAETSFVTLCNDAYLC